MTQWSSKLLLEIFPPYLRGCRTKVRQPLLLNHPETKLFQAKPCEKQRNSGWFEPFTTPKLSIFRRNLAKNSEIRGGFNYEKELSL